MTITTSGRSKAGNGGESVLLNPESPNVHPSYVFRPSKGRSLRLFLGFFIKFICPLIALFILCINAYYGPGLRIVYSWPSKQQKLMQAWEKTHGPFIREYFYEKKYDSYLPFHQSHDEQEFLEPLPDPPIASNQSCAAASNLRLDCFPRGTVSKDECIKRGCCYQLSTGSIPSCFYPQGYMSYKYTNVTIRAGFIYAEMTAAFKSPYPKQKRTMHFVVQYSENVALIYYSDVWPLPEPSPFLFPRSTVDKETNDTGQFYIEFLPKSSGFKLTRRSNGKVLFNTQNLGGLFFSDQFAEMSTTLPSEYIYGLEQRANDFPINLNWETITIFNHDTPPAKTNSYGYYPTYLCLEGDGKAHLVNFMVVTATDFHLQPGGLTLRTLFPNFGFAIRVADSPTEVYEFPITMFQYSLPPFWALGFHFSRFGLVDTAHMKETWSRIRDAKIPFDTQWSDIDYMDHRNDFTLSPKYKDLPQFVDELHKEGMHYVLITDPGISGSEPRGKYPPYDRGIKMDIFVKDSEGKNPLIGKVWNEKSTVFPDFTHENILEYWTTLIADFHKKVQFDGMWLDMNEPSNFVNGSTSGCPNNDLENPPYLPNVDGGALNYHTLCMSARHFKNTPHYFIHHIYSLYEAGATNFALTQVRGKRSLIISRSGSPETGKLAGIWTGDVFSTWDDLRQSVRDVLTFNLIEQPLVGADICGFNGNTTAALCRRWHQLGAFYPFSRNHNTDDGIDQDPVALGIQDDVRPALIKRYSLLPYLYTLFFVHMMHGSPVVRPTFLEFPNLVESYKIDTQFFWGSAILIVPALEESITYVKAFIGGGFWYNFDSLIRLEVEGAQVVLPAPNNEIPLLIRGGHIVPMFNVNGSVTTKQLRDAGSLKLAVALNETEEAVGSLFWDDGDSLSGPYSLGDFYASKGQLVGYAPIADYKDNLRIDTIQVFTVKDAISKVTVNSQNFPFVYNQTTKVLTIEPRVPVFQNLTVTWS